VIAAWQSWAPHAPDELFSVCNISSAPSIRVSGQLVGSAARLSALLRPLVGTGTPAFVRVTQRRFLEAAEYWAGCAPVSECRPAPLGNQTRATFAAKSDYLRRPLSAAAISTILQAVPRAPIRGSLLLDSYGGALNRVPKGATAFVHRDSLCSLQYLSGWDNSRDAAASIAWIRSFYAAMRPYVSGEAYVNYIDPDLAGNLRAYYGRNLPRLVSIKRRYDPANVFRFRQSVPLHL
jgi:FAD/FMN-containing dehydrogenase